MLSMENNYFRILAATDGKVIREDAVGSILEHTTLTSYRKIDMV